MQSVPSRPLPTAWQEHPLDRGVYVAPSVGGGTSRWREVANHETDETIFSFFPSRRQEVCFFRPEVIVFLLVSSFVLLLVTNASGGPFEITLNETIRWTETTLGVLDGLCQFEVRKVWWPLFLDIFLWLSGFKQKCFNVWKFSVWVGVGLILWRDGEIDVKGRQKILFIV